MYNWSTNTEELKKDPERYAKWRLEQLINFGLGGERLDESSVRKYWGELRLDTGRRRFLSILLNGNDHSQ